MQRTYRHPALPDTPQEPPWGSLQFRRDTPTLPATSPRNRHGGLSRFDRTPQPSQLPPPGAPASPSLLLTPGPTLALLPPQSLGSGCPLPVTSLALPPGSVSPHPSIMNPVSPVPGISLALSGCTGSERGTSCSPRRAQDRHRSGPSRGLLELPAPGLTLDPGSGQLQQIFTFAE